MNESWLKFKNELYTYIFPKKIRMFEKSKWILKRLDHLKYWFLHFYDFLYLNFSSVLCAKLFENTLATGSMDRTIKIWHLKKARLEMTLRGHSKGIWCLEFITNLLLCSGSFDSLIKIWNLKSQVCLRTLDAHSGPIWGFVKKGEILISVSHDKLVIK